MTSQFRIGVPFIIFPVETRDEYKLPPIGKRELLTNLQQIYIYNSFLNKYEPHNPLKPKQVNKYYRIV